MSPLKLRTAHVCVDMQRVFTADGPWTTPWLPRVLPQCTALASHRPSATIFTRFTTPPTIYDAQGAWAKLYERWPELTGECVNPDLLDLVPELAQFAPPALVVDKPVYSAFADGQLAAHLRERDIETVIFSGAETDVCVLSSALGAVDHGFHVIVAKDAVCSFSDEGHDALLGLFERRFSQQITALETSGILREWHT